MPVRLPVLTVLAFALAVILSVQAIELMRAVARQANAARLDEIARTVALRVEYQLAAPASTRIGRTMFDDNGMMLVPSIEEFAAAVRQRLAACRCVPDSGLAVHIHGATQPTVTSQHGDGQWVADTLLRQVHLSHLASFTLIGHGRFGSGRIEFGLLTTSPPSPVRLFAYAAHLGVTDTVNDIYAMEVSPVLYIADALRDSTVNPGVDTGVLAFRPPAVTLDVSDAAGRPVYAGVGQRWASGLRVRTLPTDFGSLRLMIYSAPPPAGPPSAGTGLPLVLGLFAITVGLLAVAMLQLRGEHQLASRRARFVSGISHELRTPLTQIRLFAELLRDEMPGMQAKRYEYARIIDEEAQRLTYLVDNVLAYSALDGATTMLRLRPVSLSAIVHDTIERFTPLATSRAARVQAVIPDDVIVSADEDALRRILLNVLDNAVKYGPSGQTVCVGLRVLDQSAQLTVDDAGPGIPVADRMRVFDPFVRLDNGPEGGSGIGLAIVRELVAALNGTVAIEDAPSGGTRVQFTFPL